MEQKGQGCIPSFLINSEMACSMNELPTNILVTIAAHSNLFGIELKLN